MDTARTVSDQKLGLHPDHTVDALKQQLGVTQLEVVVLNSIDEYRELLVEKPPRPSYQRRYVLIALVLLVALETGLAMAYHPGVRLDHLARLLL